MFSSGRDRLTDLARRQRRRNNSFLLVFAVGFLVFCAAAGALFYALRPAVLNSPASSPTCRMPPATGLLICERIFPTRSDARRGNGGP